MIEGGTGMSTGANATTCMSSPFYIQYMLAATDDLLMNFTFLMRWGFQWVSGFAMHSTALITDGYLRKVMFSRSSNVFIAAKAILWFTKHRIQVCITAT